MRACGCAGPLAAEPERDWIARGGGGESSSRVRRSRPAAGLPRRTPAPRVDSAS